MTASASRAPGCHRRVRHGAYTRVDLSRNWGPGQAFGASVCTKGLQRMKSDGPFTATLWGWSHYTTYAYPSGQAQRRLVDSPLVPVK